MPASPAHIAVVGKYSLEYYQKNPPVDQIQTSRPWIDRLRQNKMAFPGGKENIVVQILTDYDENGEWYYGDQEMAYNRRDGIQQAFFKWRSFRDGYTLTDDDFIENGIQISMDNNVTMSGAERIQLTNLFETRNTQLTLGFTKQLDQGFLRNGVAGSDHIKGLDYLVSTTPNVGTPAGINRAKAGNAYWRNNVGELNLATGTILEAMEAGFEACQRNGGMPNFIQMGTKAIAVYRAALKEDIGREISQAANFRQPQADGGIGQSVDGGTMTGYHFKGIPIVRNFVFSDVQALEGAGTDWDKRIQMLNMAHIKEHFVRGYDEVDFIPPTVYNREAHYFGRRWKGALCMTRANSHWTGAVA
ncbi:MAG: phage major capsid protein [Rhodospirillales bacterium]|nr:phage major capsid protein [Rhodospirillales bacterium]